MDLRSKNIVGRSIFCLCHFLLLTLLLGFTVFGQKAHFEHDDQQWVQYVNITRLPPNWIVHSSASYRWRDVYRDSFQYHLRTALGYQLTGNMRFLSGIGYFKPFNNSSSFRHEIRPFQEVSFNHILGKTGIINRFQIEERFMKKIESDLTEPMYFRFRYALFFTFPLMDFANAEKDNKLGFTVRNELFLNSNTNPKDKIFDLERITLGPILSLNNWRLLALWHNQVSSLVADNNYRYTSIFVFQVMQILDFSSSKEKLQGSQNYGD